MADSALVVRSIHTVDNYDAVVEFRFHQNGALAVSVYNSGYLLAEFFSTEDAPYGFKVAENITGSLTFNAAHFKVDLDVGGVNNSYQTLDIQQVDARLRSTPGVLGQTKFSRNVRRTELESVYSEDFEMPR
ncbi:putative amine oxidase [copper-containing], partial [Aplysia californica]|uniref:Amine oxidase n=1 Tax=Aplysia californica TaxID=6500 RepID=A0ABM1AC11_APLCA